MAALTGEKTDRGRRDAGGSCRSCGAALPEGAHYCIECGTSADLIAVDLFHVGEPPMPAEPERPPGRGLWVLVGLVAATVAVLWALAYTVDRPGDGPAASDVPTGDVVGDPITAPTTEAPTTAAPTTAAPTTPTTATGVTAVPTTTDPDYVGGVPGPVLGGEVDGMLILVGGSRLLQVDLASGEITRIELDHSLSWFGPDGDSVIVDGNHVMIRSGQLIVTHLSDGSQPEPVAFDEVGSGEVRVVGRAGAESVWVSKESWPDGVSAAIEVGLDGEIRRRVDLPGLFWVVEADGDEIVLESPEGMWRYDASTGTGERMPDGVIEYRSGLAIQMSCDETLDCDVLVDTGDAPAIVDWLDPDDLIHSEIRVSPDQRGLLLHRYPNGWGGPEQGMESTYIDLRTGSRTDLGRLDIEPWIGITWIGDTDWIIGQSESFRMGVTAIDTRTGDQVPIDLDRYAVVLAYMPPP